MEEHTYGQNIDMKEYIYIDTYMKKYIYIKSNIY